MEELRIGVIGCGAIGRDHIRRINTSIQGARVTAVSDVYEAGGRETANRWNATFYQDGCALIGDAQVDAVVIASLDESHETFVLECIRQGKFVLCEKPLAPDEAACRRIIDAEIAGGRQLVQVGFMRRYDEGYKALREVIRKETYGRPLMLHCAHRNPQIEGFTTAMLISNCLSHEIDVLRWLLGEEYVSCQVLLPKASRLAKEGLQDPQILLLETESGVRIDVEAFGHCQYGYDIRCEVVCEQASCSLPQPTGVLTLHDGSRALPVSADWKERFVAAYDAEFREWVDATRQGLVKGPSAWDGYLCTATATMCGKARDTGEIIKISTRQRPDFYGQNPL